MSAPGTQMSTIRIPGVHHHTRARFSNALHNFFMVFLFYTFNFFNCYIRARFYNVYQQTVHKKDYLALARFRIAILALPTNQC